MGGALLQKVNRDTQKFALKCSYAEVDGRPVMVQKSPKEMDENGNLVQSFKTSKAGRLMLVRDSAGFRTVAEGAEAGLPDILETVFENGEIKKEYTFAAIRNQA
jgi:nicotinamide phosphoribosyltransferase